MKFFYFFICIFLLMSVSYADNWVCYDSSPDGSLKASTLRAKFNAINMQPNSPLQIIRTGSKNLPIYTNAVHFRDCESNTFNYCPENDYFLKTIFSEITKCLKFGDSHHQYIWDDINAQCGLGGSPYCSKWSSSTGVADTSYVCGYNDEKWKVMTASTNWNCPSCKELALWQKGNIPILDLSSFDMLSLGTFPLFSNTTVDVSFNFQIPACINRIPFANLDVSLVDNQTGEVYDNEVGIYAKHTSMIYNSENIGLMEDFNVPIQDEFMKTYSLNSTLKGYRAWAWRNRLYDGINKLLTNNPQLTIPGFPLDTTPQRIEDLYVSSDFLGGIEFDDLEMDFSQVQTSKKSFAINTLRQIDSIGFSRICTVNDFKNYYYNYGITSSLLSVLKDEVSIDDSETVTSITFNNDPNRETSFKIENVIIDLKKLDTIEGYGSGNTFNIYPYINLYDLNLYLSNGTYVSRNYLFKDWIEVNSNLIILENKLKNLNIIDDKYTVLSYGTEYGYDDSTNFQIRLRVKSQPTRYESLVSYLNNGFYYHKDVFGEIIQKKLVSDYKISSEGMESMGNFFSNIPFNCYDYRAKYSGLDLKNYISYSKINDDTVRMSFNVNAVWINDIGVVIDVYTSKAYDVESSWSWKGLVSVEPKNLANCLYNWDDCINRSVIDSGKTYYEVADCGMGPPSSLENPSEKDAARGSKNLLQQVTIYRSCISGDNWISKENTHACSNGHIYRCEFSPSADTVGFVKKALVGQKVRNGDSRVFVCTRGGIWKPILCE